MHEQWLINRLYQTGGQDVLWPKVTGTLLEMGFNWGDIDLISERARTLTAAPKLWYKVGISHEAQAERELALGHTRTAGELYLRVARCLARARWGAHFDDAENAALYEKLNASYDKGVEYIGARITRVTLDVGGTVFGLLHLPPEASADHPVPVVLLLPGMDMTKEYLPAPENNIFASRGLAVLSLDPPGHGFTWANGLHISARNVEATCGAAIDELADHPEIDIDKVTIIGLGTGGYFGVSTASQDDRVKAVAGIEGGFFYDNVAMLADEAPVRRARLRRMSGLTDDKLDALMTEISIEGREADVTCPVLLVTGEWDELTPPKELRRLFNALGGATEMVIYEDEGHVIGGAMFDALHRAADFLADRSAGIPLVAHRVDTFVARSI